MSEYLPTHANQPDSSSVELQASTEPSPLHFPVLIPSHRSSSKVTAIASSPHPFRRSASSKAVGNRNPSTLQMAIAHCKKTKLTLSPPTSEHLFTSSKRQFPTVSRLFLTPQTFEVTKESSSTTGMGGGEVSFCIHEFFDFLKN